MRSKKKKQNTEELTEKLIGYTLKFFGAIAKDPHLGLPDPTQDITAKEERTNKYLGLPLGTVRQMTPSINNYINVSPSKMRQTLDEEAELKTTNSTPPSAKSHKTESLDRFLASTCKALLSWEYARQDPALFKDYYLLVHTYQYNTRYSSNAYYKFLRAVYTDENILRMWHLRTLRSAYAQTLSRLSVRHRHILIENESLFAGLGGRIDHAIYELEQGGLRGYRWDGTEELITGALKNTPESQDFMFKYGVYPTPPDFKMPLGSLFPVFQVENVNIGVMMRTLDTYVLWKKQSLLPKGIALKFYPDMREKQGIDRVVEDLKRGIKEVERRDMSDDELKDYLKELPCLPCDNCADIENCGIYQGGPWQDADNRKAVDVLCIEKESVCRRTNFICDGVRKCQVFSKLKPKEESAAEHKRRRDKELIRRSYCKILDKRALKYYPKDAYVKDLRPYRNTKKLYSKMFGTRKTFWKGKKNTNNEDRRFVEQVKIIYKYRDSLDAISRSYGHNAVLPWWINSGSQPDKYTTRPDWPCEKYREQYKGFLESQGKRLKGSYREDLKGRDGALYQFFFGKPKRSSKKAALRFLKVDNVALEIAEQKVYLWWWRIWKDILTGTNKELLQPPKRYCGICITSTALKDKLVCPSCFEHKCSECESKGAGRCSRNATYTCGELLSPVVFHTPYSEQVLNHDIAWQTLWAYLVLAEPGEEHIPPKPGRVEPCETCGSLRSETFVRLKPTIKFVCEICIYLDEERRSEWDSLSPEERARNKAMLYHTLPGCAKPGKGYEKYLPHPKPTYPQYWANVPKFLVGDRIGHPVFGAGVIRAVYGNGVNTMITVDFKNSTETLPALSSCLFRVPVGAVEKTFKNVPK